MSAATKDKGHVPTHQRAALCNAGLSADHPAHRRYSITFDGAQANDVQSECPTSTSDGNQKTPDERDP
jgi:hypothetical protein